MNGDYLGKEPQASICREAERQFGARVLVPRSRPG
jgi:hypothetical protein